MKAYGIQISPFLSMGSFFCWSLRLISLKILSFSSSICDCGAQTKSMGAHAFKIAENGGSRLCQIMSEAEGLFGSTKKEIKVNVRIDRLYAMGKMVFQFQIIKTLLWFNWNGEKFNENNKFFIIDFSVATGLNNRLFWSFNSMNFLRKSFKTKTCLFCFWLGRVKWRHSFSAIRLWLFKEVFNDTY